MMDQQIAEGLRVLRAAMRDLHKSLLDAERLVYEKAFGRIGSDFYLLQLASEDPQFAWLRALSREMLRLDDLIAQEETPTEAELQVFATRVRKLLLPDEPMTGFQNRYQMALQEHPSVIMAHAAVMRALPPAMRVPFYVSGTEEEVEQHGDLRVVMHRPGAIVPGHGDHGYGPLAAVAESMLPSGGVLPMNEHRNDEIISWVPKGTMRHDDRKEGKRVVDADHLLVMNTGSRMTHSERTLESDPDLRMLQVFVRPSGLELEPVIQHGELVPSGPDGWRALVGPEGEDAPFYVRNAVEMHDGRFAAGSTVALPRRKGWHRYLFVYEGRVTIEKVTLGASGTALIPTDTELKLTVDEDAVLAHFLVDPRAKVTRAGTVGR